MKLFLLLYLFLMSFTVTAQTFSTADPVYPDTLISKVYITIHPDSLALILQPGNQQSDYEFSASFRFVNDFIDQSVNLIGFRLRGNTSRDSQKKSWKVSFNTFIKGQKFFGLEKLNLNGEHNDPTIMRSKISWKIFNDFGIPSSRASFVELYINDTYYGLYINVEHVDENFVKIRFGNNDGNLFKCLWPADLVFINNNPDSYKLFSGNRQVYEIKTNKEKNDYSDLARFIRVINQTSSANLPDSLEPIFDVNGYLKIMAVDVVTAMWDNYAFNKNNYYLYNNTATGKFQFIPYDYDNTFGIWWSGILANTNWATRGMYTWGHPTESRPLYNKILSVQKYKDRYTFYIKQLIAEIYTSDNLHPYIDRLHNIITPSAENDIPRTLDYGYSISQFHDAYNSALGAHVTYGLKPFITARRTAITQQHHNNNISPIIYQPKHFLRDGKLFITVKIEDESPNPDSKIVYSQGNISFAESVLLDDGINDDGIEGNKIYGNYLPDISFTEPIQFYIQSTDANSATNKEPFNAPTKFFTIVLNPNFQSLFINEFMASNNGIVKDPFMENDDWIELYNASNEPISLKNMFITDNPGNFKKFALPDTTIDSKGFLIVWADEQKSQGPLHANFKLGAGGEFIGLFEESDSGLLVIDSLTFGPQTTNISYGRLPDGGNQWQFLPIHSFGISNSFSVSVEGTEIFPTQHKLFQNYPNPFNPTTKIMYQVSQQIHVKITVFDLLGRELSVLVNDIKPTGSYQVEFHAENLPSGIYWVHLSTGSFSETKKMVLMK